LLGIVVFSLRFVSVQNFVLQQTETWLSKKLATKLSLGTIKIDFSEGIHLENCYIEDQKGDTLAAIGKLDISSNLWTLLTQKVDVKNISLENITLHLEKTDSIYNFDFIQKAFSSGNSEKSPANWLIQAQNATVSLQNLHFKFKDNTQQTLIQSSVPQCFATIEAIDLNSNSYALQSLTIDKAAYSYQDFKQQNSVVSKQQFNQNDYAFQEIFGKLKDLRIEDNRILANIEQITTKEKCGLQLKKCSTEIAFLNNNQLISKNIQLQINESALNGDIELVFPNATQTMNDLMLKTSIQGDLKCQDLLFFTNEAVVEKNKADNFQVFGKLEGTLAALHFQDFNFQYGNENQLNCNGVLNNVLQPNILFADFNIQKLNIVFHEISDWTAFQLPEPFLPNDKIQASGKLSVSPNKNDFDLHLSFDRKEASIISDIKGQIWSKDFVPNNLDIVIQKMKAPKTLLEELIPKDFLPKDAKLPDTLLLYGTVKGKMDSLQLALNIESERGKGNSTIQINAYLLPQKKPSAFFQMERLIAELSPDEIWAWLPSKELKKVLVLDRRIPILADFKGSSSKYAGNVEIDLGESGLLKSNFSSNGNTISIKSKTEQFDYSSFLTDSLKVVLGIPKALPLDADIVFDLDSMQNFSTNFKVAQLAFGKPLKKEVSTSHVSEDDSFAFEEHLTIEKSSNSLSDYPFYLKNISGKSEGNLKKNQFENTQLSFFVRDKRYINSLPTHSEMQVDLNLNNAFFPEKIEPSFKGSLILENILVETSGSKSNENLPEDVVLQKDNVKKPSDVNAFFNISPQSDSLQIKSDWLNLGLNGHFDIVNISTHFQSFINDYFHLNEADIAFSTTDFLNLKGNIQPNAILPKPLLGSLQLPNTIVFKSDLLAASHRAHLDVQADTLNMNEMAFRRISFNLDADEKALNYDLKIPMYKAFSDTILQNSIHGSIANDIATVDFLQKDSLQKARYDIGLGFSLKDKIVEAKLFSTPIINFQRWVVDAKNKLFYNLKTSDFSIENLAISQQNLAANSISIAGNSQQTILMDCNNFKLNSLGSVFYADSSRIGGLLNGKIMLQNIYQQPMIDADLNIKNLAYQDAEFGDVNLDTKTILSAKGAIQQSDFNLKLNKNEGDATIVGHVLQNDSLDIHGLFNRFDCSVLLPFVQPTFTNLSGRATGNFDVAGTLQQPNWQGLLKLNEFCFKPAANLVSYCLNEENIAIKKDFIAFSNLKIQDENGSIATINGKITPIEFPSFDLDLTLKAKDFLVLNNQKDKKSNYQGIIKADIKGNIKGSSDFPDLYLSLEVKENSKLTYRYDGGATVKDLGDGLIVFESKKSKKSQKKPEKVVKPFSYKLNMDLTDNENLQFKTLIDPVKGDLFEGKGTGNLHLNIQPDGAMNLVGKYILTSGKYVYALNSFIKRNFEVANGSYLSWTGNPFNPELEITANYLVKTLPPPLAQLPNETSKVTFITAIETTGSLEKPSINFKIKYPTGEEGKKYANPDNSLIQPELDNINNNPAELSGTVVSLLTLNTFPSTGDYNLGVDLRLTNLLSNQLNTLAKDVKFVDLSFNAADINGQDPNALGINLGKEFFNKRLKIQVTSSALGQNSRLLQNVVTTYALKNNKDWKFRAAFEGEDNLIFQDNPSNKLGIGLTYAKSFNRLSRRKK
jgi:hypothetical protein